MKRPFGGDRARGESSRVVPARAVRASVAIVLLIPHLSGCFHYVPVNHSATPNGIDVSVAITDRGRVELSPRLGHGVQRLRGQLLESTDTSLVLSVTSVQYVDTNVPAVWPTERMEITRDFVSDVRERRLSRSRTGIAAALLIAAAVAVSAMAITGFGGGGGERSGPGTEEPQ